MTALDVEAGGAATSAGPPGGSRESDARHAAYFHALDSWTEYWDIYHPESSGRFYFGDGIRPGLLELLLPRREVPPVFVAWKRHALGTDTGDSFGQCAAATEVAAAAVELDALVGRLFTEHFGEDIDDAVRSDYLAAIHRFATDSLPAASERLGRLGPDDPRRRTAGRHTIDADMMWFIWSLQLEVAQIAQIAPGDDAGSARRSLLLAGVAAGCSADFAWRGHRRTRPEYRPDAATITLLASRALTWSRSFGDAAAEVHALYRIREWGHTAGA